MKNFKTVLIAGLMIGLVPQVALPMEEPNDNNKPEESKSIFKNYIDKGMQKAIGFINRKTPVTVTFAEPQKLHPDIQDFLRKEMMEKSSLSNQDIADLKFKVLGDKKTLDDMTTLWSYGNNTITFVPFTKQKPVYTIYIPNIDDLFEKVEAEEGNVRYIEKPDTELPYRSKRKKALLSVHLKREEGRVFQYNNEKVSSLYPLKTTAVAYFFGLRAKHLPVLYCALLGMQGGLNYRAELKADAYAINHIDDSTKLKEMSRHLKRSSTPEGTIELNFPPRPSLESRATLFLDAAKKLEKQVKDRN